MKTLNIKTALIAIIFLMVSIHLAADTTFCFNEEGYVDDIPFDTEMICHKLTLPTIDFEEEAYVQDIPFNTEDVASRSSYHAAVSVEYDLEEEGYVDDIPFNTVEVAENYTLRQSLEVRYDLDEEEYVDDIPFNTKTVVARMNRSAANSLYASGK